MPRIPRLRRDASQEPSAEAQTALQDATTQPPADGEAPTTQIPALSGAPADGVATAGAATASGAAPTDAPATDAPATQPVVPSSPGFAERARMRRRLRYLRRLRELAFRDVGGLVFDLHRFGRDRGDLVAAKLESLSAIDHELRALEDALGDRRPLHELHEAGIAACPRCATLHGSDANFCPGCGTPLRGTVVREAGAVSIAPAEPQA